VSRRVKIVLAVIAALALAAGGFRYLRHQSDLVPALVTPAMNVHNEFSGDALARAYRVTHNMVASADRSKRPKLIALTFDDGPYPVYTPLLLDELHRLGVRATFFLIGRDAEQWPEITKRIEAEGHEIADHTYSHPELDHETADQVREEVLKGRDVLWSLAHDPAERELMRPPHGRYTMATLQAVQSVGFDVVLWTDDSGDWRTLTAAQIAGDMLRHATAPDIVLLHSGKLATIQALAPVVQRFKDAGYEFVTAGELLRRVSPEELNHPAKASV
jgi:peptidoglycan/xylan/chitin deacetylase (PgdA/CDA1 family)